MTRRPYRDGGLALREKLASLEQGVRERHARLLPAFWRHLPESAGERLRDLAEQLERCPVEDGDRREALLRAYLAALDGALAVVPRLELELADFPDELTPVEPPEVSSPWPNRAFAGPSLERLSEDSAGSVLAHLRALDPQARVARVDVGAWVGSASFGNAPLAIAFRWTHANEMEVQPDFVMVTTMRKGAPVVRVRPETWGHSITKVLRIDRDVEVGDEGFDTLFLVDAEPDDARYVLTAEVRGALMRLGRYDVPRLEVGPGRAELRWRYEPEAPVLERATAVLLALRALAPPGALVASGT